MSRAFKTIIIILVIIVAAIFASHLVPLPGQEYIDRHMLAPADGRFVTVNGYETFIVEQGPADGQAVVLIHGFGGGTFNWRYTMPALADARYRAVAVDLKGFHVTEKGFDNDYSHPAQAAMVLGVMDQLDIQHAVLVGHSMGANIVSHIALAYPDRVSKLVLVDASIVEKNQWTNQIGGIFLRFPPLKRWAQLIIRWTVTPEFFQEGLERFYHDAAIVDQELIDTYVIPLHIRGWDSGLVRMLSDYHRNELPEPIDQVSVPTHIIWGEYDSAIPLSTGQQIHDRIHWAEFTIIAKAGHIPMEEQAKAFNNTLLDYIQ